MEIQSVNRCVFSCVVLCFTLSCVVFMSLIMSCYPFSCADVSGAPAEDGASAAPAAAAAEAGPLLPVQLCGADVTHVSLCSAGPLASMCVVRHWLQAARKQ